MLKFDVHPEVGWQAVRYVARRMSPAELAAFESRLATDQSAREAVAQSVELCHTATFLHLSAADHADFALSAHTSGQGGQNCPAQELSPPLSPSSLPSEAAPVPARRGGGRWLDQANLSWLMGGIAAGWLLFTLWAPARDTHLTSGNPHENPGQIATAWSELADLPLSASESSTPLEDHLLGNAGFTRDFPTDQEEELILDWVVEGLRPTIPE